MIARPAIDLCERICRARQHFHLQIAQMAAELRVRPEWLSKILNGHQPPSYNLGLRFEDFLRRRGLDAEAFAQEAPAPRTGGTEPDALRKRIEAEYRSLMASVGDNVDQLETIADRMPLLRLPRREYASGSPEARPATTAGLAPRAPRTPKATNGAASPSESAPRTEGTPPMVARDVARRDIIAERYHALARERAGGSLRSSGIA